MATPKHPEWNADSSASKRNPLRISLRTSFAFLTLLCLWLGWHCSEAQQQRRAVRWLKVRGCLVGYDDQINAGGVMHDASSSIPDWLSSVLGKDFFYHVVEVQFEQPLVIDDDVMDRLDALPRLTHLGARHCTLAPDIERRFGKLSALEDLELELCWLNDKQLAAFGELTKLRILNLQHNSFRGTGLASWDRLDNLETLYLSDTAVTDENLVHLSKLENLRSLYLGDTGLGDPGLAHIANISSLRHLSINDLYGHQKCSYTNHGVAKLTALQNLERLDLGKFPLTVQNLDALELLPRFRTLWVEPGEADPELQQRLVTPANPFPPFKVGASR